MNRKLNKLLSIVFRFASYSANVLAAWLLVPIVAFCLLGIYLVAIHDYWMELFVMLVSLTLIFCMPLFLAWIKQRWTGVAVNTEEYVNYVEPSEEWSESEVKIFESSKVFIRTLLKENDSWTDLNKQSVKIAESIAQQYGKNYLDFSFIEGVALLEESSRRFRHTLQTAVPRSITDTKLSTANFIRQRYKKYGQKTIKAGRFGLKFYRFARISDPLQAIASEFFGKITDVAAKQMVFNIKCALLQEVSKLAIDLYSSRFYVNDEQLFISKAHERDCSNQAAEVEPIRIVVCGQISAGKSALINALKGDIVAEVDVLPTQANVTAHSFTIDGIEELRIVDLPGLDGNNKNESSIFAELIEADVVLWILKANQPSRQNDKQLCTRIETFFKQAENVSRKRPTIIGILNQVDRLKPIKDWTPPFNIGQPKTEKEKVIADAIAFNQSILTFDTLLPLAIPDNKSHFGLDEIKRCIEQNYNSARNTQLNRKRTEAIERNDTVIQSTKRLFRLSSVVAKKSLMG